MPRRLTFATIFLLMLCGCGSRAHSDLEEALSRAVKEEKLSEKKKVIILKEYEIIRDEDKERARTYVEQVVRAVEMGGDSTHIDAVRKLAAGQRKGS
jgi:hypothetical protein